jgi:hypothetical protein
LYIEKRDQGFGRGYTSWRDEIISEWRFVIDRKDYKSYAICFKLLWLCVDFFEGEVIE